MSLIDGGKISRTRVRVPAAPLKIFKMKDIGALSKHKKLVWTISNG